MHETIGNISEQIYSLNDIMKMLGIKRTTFWRMRIREDFPKPIKHWNHKKKNWLIKDII